MFGIIVLSILGLIIGLFLLSKILKKLTLTYCKSTRRLDGKVAIVTGSSRGMGYETGKDLARRGAKVILACIDLPEAESARDEILKETKNHKVIVMHLDLSSMVSVRKFCKEFKSKESRLDILVNNAGIITNKKEKNAEGFELNFATNYLGHFLLTNILFEYLKKTVGSRIVVVSSVGHNLANSLDLDNLNSEVHTMEAMEYYAMTKLENILFMREMDKRMKAKGINVTINALNPGAVNTTIAVGVKFDWKFKLIGLLGLLVLKTPFEGAQTHIHLAVSEEVDGISGEYFNECKVSETSKLGKDMALAKNLWEKSEKYCKIQKQEIFC